MNRVFCLIGFSYFVSLFLSSFIPENILLYVFGTLLIASGICCLIEKFRKEKTLPFSLLVCAIAVLVNFLNFNFNISEIQKLDGKDSSVSGQIVELPYKKNNRYNYVLKIENVDGEKIRPFKTKLSSSEPLEADIFDIFKGKVHFYLPENTPSFDLKSYYRSKNIHILSFAYNYSPYEIETFNDSKNIRYYILKLRKKMLSLPKYIFTDRIANIINGFLLGEKHNFPEDVKNNFDRAGVYHLIATSGIHISILSQFCLWILKKLRLGFRSSSILVSIAILFFMTLTGFSPSVTRAGTVTIIYNLGSLIFRRSDPLNSLGLAVLLICLFSPNSATNIGLCLSVFSSLGIILSEKRINTRISEKIRFKDSKILNYFISIVSVSLAVSLFTLPIVMWFYKKVSLISLISNLVLIPLATLLLTTSVILQVLMLLGTTKILTMPLALVCGVTTNLIDDLSAALSKIPFSMIYFDYGFMNLCLAFSLVLVGISLLFKDFKKSMSISLILSAIIHIVGIISYAVLTYDLTRVAVINCSDGIGVVVSKGFRKAAIIYPGEKFNESNLNSHLLKLSEYSFDYLNVPNISSSRRFKINDFIKNYNPKTILIPESLKDDIKYSKNQEIYINNTSSKLWKNIKIDTFESDDHTFIVVKINEVKFLICSNGGDASEIPEEYKSCDFLIVGKLPMNYECISTKKIIVSGNKENSEIILNKLLLQTENLFSTAHNGNLYIDVDNKSKFKIRRFQ